MKLQVNKAGNARTSKDGELGQNLRVVPLFIKRKAKKRGKYEDFENRMVERGLWTMALKGYVNTISKGQLSQRNVPIVFLDQDLEMVKLPHAYPLIIKLWIGNTMVSRVLVDGGSSLDILLWEAFQRMGIDKEVIQPAKTYLHHLTMQK